MNHAPNRLGAVLLGSALLFAGCSGGAGGGNAAVPAANLREKTSFVSSIQDEINAANGFPAFSVHAQLGIAFAGNHSGLPAQSAQRLIYSGDFDNNSISYFSTQGINPPPLGQITTGLNEPERLFVDNNLNLYATNLGNSSITEYAPGGTSPILTITDGVNSPTGITVDSNGTIYCANVGNDTITEYPAGQTSPSVTINLGSNTAEYLAIGPKGALFASLLGGNVLKFAAGSTQGTLLNLELGSAGAIEIGKGGYIIVIDANSDALDVFPPGHKKPLRSLAIGGFPFSMAFNKAQTQLYISNLENSGWIVQSLVYPNGHVFVNKITSNINGWPIAASPGTVL